LKKLNEQLREKDQKIGLMQGDIENRIQVEQKLRANI
jgi:hypothetical protein